MTHAWQAYRFHKELLQYNGSWFYRRTCQTISHRNRCDALHTNHTANAAGRRRAAAQEGEELRPGTAKELGAPRRWRPSFFGNTWRAVVFFVRGWCVSAYVKEEIWFSPLFLNKFPESKFTRLFIGLGDWWPTQVPQVVLWVAAQNVVFCRDSADEWPHQEADVAEVYSQSAASFRLDFVQATAVQQFFHDTPRFLHGPQAISCHKKTCNWWLYITILIFVILRTVIYNRLIMY